MIKILLIDADGVALLNKGYLSENYARDYNIAVEKLTPFFKKEFRDAQLAKADIKEALPKYFGEWGWQKSTEEFLQYWFENYTLEDHEVINKIQEFRKKGIKCYLATDQEKHRANYITEDLDFKNKFDGMFFSYQIGFQKSAPDFFINILNELGVEPNEVLYFDDDEGNIKCAEQLGIQSKLYRSIADLYSVE